ncbi:hypothetical protein [Ramlibacter albus]|nr:hypothetical protein [Ramlibacter albus]
MNPRRMLVEIGIAVAVVVLACGMQVLVPRLAVYVVDHWPVRR